MFDVLEGYNERSQGIEHRALKYGIRSATASKYFRHAITSLYSALDRIQRKLIRWPNTGERKAMQGIISGFTSYLFLVEGKKNKRRLSKDEDTHERAHNGYKNTHCFSFRCNTIYSGDS